MGQTSPYVSTKRDFPVLLDCIALHTFHSNEIEERQQYLILPGQVGSWEILKKG